MWPIHRVLWYLAWVKQSKSHPPNLCYLDSLCLGLWPYICVFGWNSLFSPFLADSQGIGLTYRKGKLPASSTTRQIFSDSISLKKTHLISCSGQAPVLSCYFIISHRFVQVYMLDNSWHKFKNKHEPVIIFRSTTWGFWAPSSPKIWVGKSV